MRVEQSQERPDAHVGVVGVGGCVCVGGGSAAAR